jgi:hypothetical protein
VPGSDDTASEADTLLIYPEVKILYSVCIAIMDALPMQGLNAIAEELPAVADAS